MVFKKILGAGLIVASFAACTTLYPVKLEVLMPAKVVIPADLNKVAVVNAAFVNSSVPISGEDQQFNYVLDTLFSQKMADAITYFLSESPRIAEVNHVMDIEFRPASEIGKPINDSLINHWSSVFNSDGVLSINAFDVDFEVIKKFLKEGEEEYSWSISYMVSKVHYGLYNNKNFSLQKVQTDTMYLGGFDTASDLAFYLSQDEGRDELANDMASIIATKISDNLVPYWEERVRYLYTPQLTDFDRANRFVVEENWNAAMHIWYKYAEVEQGRVPAIAAYNLAIAKEYHGELDSAFYWVKEAELRKETNFITKYKEALEQRVKYEKELNKQFGLK